MNKIRCIKTTLASIFILCLLFTNRIAIFFYNVLYPNPAPGLIPYDTNHTDVLIILHFIIFFLCFFLALSVMFIPERKEKKILK